jgi:hypothetical protein
MLKVFFLGVLFEFRRIVAIIKRKEGEGKKW